MRSDAIRHVCPLFRTRPLLMTLFNQMTRKYFKSKERQEKNKSKTKSRSAGLTQAEQLCLKELMKNEVEKASSRSKLAELLASKV